MKVSILDRRLRTKFYKIFSILSLVAGTILFFYTIPNSHKIWYGIGFIVLVFLVFLVYWWRENNLTAIEVDVDGSEVKIVTGDIFDFSEKGLICITFNEYFDTIADDVLVSKKTINGQFLDQLSSDKVKNLDKSFISDISEECKKRNITTKARGKNQKYKLGTVLLYEDKYLLTAFSKFDEDYKAYLTMPDYLSFLINFWDQVNSVYSLRSVYVPVFGSGITRIKGHKTIEDEDLLKIILWTFKISEMRFKHPANLTIVIHSDKIDKINLFDIKELGDGL